MVEGSGFAYSIRSPPNPAESTLLRASLKASILRQHSVRGLEPMPFERISDMIDPAYVEQSRFLCLLEKPHRLPVRIVNVPDVVFHHCLSEPHRGFPGSLNLILG